jgi:hypothetical protein
MENICPRFGYGKESWSFMFRNKFLGFFGPLGSIRLYWIGEVDCQICSNSYLVQRCSEISVTWIPYNYINLEKLFAKCKFHIGLLTLKGKKYSYPRNRPWRPTGLWDVEAPTFSRQSVHRWRWGCHPYAPAALYAQEKYLILIFVRGWVNVSILMRLERLDKFKNPMTLSEIEAATFRLVT